MLPPSQAWAGRPQVLLLPQCGADGSKNRFSARGPIQSSVTLLPAPSQSPQCFREGLGAMLFSWASRGRELWRIPLRESFEAKSAPASFRNIQYLRLDFPQNKEALSDLSAKGFPVGSVVPNCGEVPKDERDKLHQARHCQDRQSYAVAATSSSYPRDRRESWHQQISAKQRRVQLPLLQKRKMSLRSKTLHSTTWKSCRTKWHRSTISTASTF